MSPRFFFAEMGPYVRLRGEVMWGGVEEWGTSKEAAVLFWDGGGFVYFFVSLGIKNLGQMFTTKKILTVAAVLLALGVVLWYLSTLGAVRVDADSNKLLVASSVERGSKVFRAKYKDPESFDDYVFVYDPSEVLFDSYSVNFTRRDGSRNSGRLTRKGEIFPGDASKRMISLAGAARSNARKYVQPSGSRAKDFVSGITVQFFLTGTRSEEENARFQAVGERGQFMVRKGGKYLPVTTSSRRL